MILDFTNEVEKNPSDFYFTLYIRLEESQSLSNLGDVFWDKMFVHTGRPEEGDVFENRFLQRGFTYLIDREENGYRYIRVVFYGLLNTTKQQCEELMNSLDIGAKGTDYEKALAIYNWVTTHCEYGRTEIDGRRLFDSAYGARFHTATCNGISQLVYDMMLYAGVPCRIVHCNSHAWNIVKIDGQWYIVDATFGLPKNGPSYFLLGSNNYKKWADRYTDKLGGNIEIAKENYHS